MDNMTNEQKIALITGAASGLGLETAIGLARQGIRVLVVGRNQATGTAAVERIRQESGKDLGVFLLADLSSQTAVRQLATQVRQFTDRLDILINNAGIVLPKRQETVDGIEENLSVNLLAPVILTQELLPLLKAAKQGRVINVSTAVEPLGGVRLKNIERRKGYSSLGAYAGTKRALALWSHNLSRQLKYTNITVNIFDPYVMRTPFATAKSAPLLFKIVAPFLLRPAHAARGLIKLATKPGLANTTGGRFLLGVRFIHLPGTGSAKKADQLQQLVEPLINRPKQEMARH